MTASSHICRLHAVLYIRYIATEEQQRGGPDAERNQCRKRSSTIALEISEG
jgi:hypothetical protein